VTGRTRSPPSPRHVSEPLTFEDLLPPVTDLGEDFAEALSTWRWIVPAFAGPLLITALGDLFLVTDGVSFLDTERGTLELVATDRYAWKRELEDTDRVWDWFKPDRVQELREAGLILQSGEVYSPLVPAILGGSPKPENYTTAEWRGHMNFLGQVHAQVRDLPLGTRIERINFENIPRQKK
jgi:hypothetical protein